MSCSPQQKMGPHHCGPCTRSPPSVAREALRVSQGAKSPDETIGPLGTVLDASRTSCPRRPGRRLKPMGEGRFAPCGSKATDPSPARNTPLPSVPNPARRNLLLGNELLLRVLPAQGFLVQDLELHPAVLRHAERGGGGRDELALTVAHIGVLRRIQLRELVEQIVRDRLGAR